MEHDVFNYNLESVCMEKLAFCHSGCWSIVLGHLGTEMALSALTRIKHEALADAEFGLRPGRTCIS